MALKYKQNALRGRGTLAFKAGTSFIKNRLNERSFGSNKKEIG